MKKSINNDVIFNGTLQEILVPFGNWRRYETETIIRLYIELVERNYKPSISVKNSVYEFCQAEGVARIEEINNYELIKSRTIQDKTSFVREKKEIRKGVEPKVKTGEFSSAGNSFYIMAVSQIVVILLYAVAYVLVKNDKVNIDFLSNFTTLLFLTYNVVNISCLFSAAAAFQKGAN